VRLFLVQHGEAAAKEVNSERPLTERGGAEVTRVARAAHAAGVAVATICHSGKLRAAQTADIFATELKVERAPTPLEGLGPNDHPGLIRGTLDSLDSPTMLVGHLPSLSRLCSLLLVDDPDWEIIRFRMGGIVCLGTDDTDAWRLFWMLTAELVPSS